MNTSPAAAWGSSSDLAKALFRSPKPSFSSSDDGGGGSMDSTSRSSTGMMITNAEFEAKLKYDMKYRDHAITALTTSHSSDSLFCLLAVFEWSTAASTLMRIEQERRIINDYIRANSPREIFLDSALRNTIVSNCDQGKSNESALLDLKRFILTDLKFSPLLAKLLFV